MVETKLALLAELNKSQPVTDPVYRQLWAICHSDIGEDMDAYEALFRAFIDFKGYTFKAEVAEGSIAEASVEAAGYDVERAFYDHINSVESYNNPRFFASICEMYLEPATGAKQQPIDMVDLARNLCFINRKTA